MADRGRYSTHCSQWTGFIGGRIAALLLIAFSPAAMAQLDNVEAPVVVGHYTLNVSNVDEHLRFWVDALGGEVADMGEGVNAVRFPGVFIFLNEQVPNGPTRGTTFDHIGFAVPDVPASSETASPPTAGDYGRFEYLVGPDGVKVELVTAQGDDAPPIAHHHVHFVNRDFVEMQQWYILAFNATPREGQTDFFAGADLQQVGYMLNFFSWLPDENLVGTAGRAVDHVGFEVRDLEAFCDQLVAKGIELTEPYHLDGDFGIAVITDPWGTVIELTEGLRDVY